eukprot:5683750-Pyramimonas_sp.AAC.1
MASDSPFTPVPRKPFTVHSPTPSPVSAFLAIRVYGSPPKIARYGCERAIRHHDADWRSNNNAACRCGADLGVDTELSLRRALIGGRVGPTYALGTSTNRAHYQNHNRRWIINVTNPNTIEDPFPGDPYPHRKCR